MNTQNSSENKVPYAMVCCGPCASWQTVMWGIVLIGLGGLGLVSLFVPLPPTLGRFILPALLVLWGSLTLLNRRRTRS